MSKKIILIINFKISVLASTNTLLPKDSVAVLASWPQAYQIIWPACRQKLTTPKVSHQRFKVISSNPKTPLNHLHNQLLSWI